jgi:hypothetical protein
MTKCTAPNLISNSRNQAALGSVDTSVLSLAFVASRISLALGVDKAVLAALERLTTELSSEFCAKELDDVEVVVQAALPRIVEAAAADYLLISQSSQRRHVFRLLSKMR